MLASAGIPGAFPFRIIDQELYVDGGVTGNILYGGRAEDEDALPAVWQRTYPDVPIPEIRFWNYGRCAVKSWPRWSSKPTRSPDLP
jgi:hypothetical protein